MLKVFVPHLAASAALTLAPGIGWAQVASEVERYVYSPHTMWPGDGWSAMVVGPLFRVLLLALLIAAIILSARWAGGPWAGPITPHHISSGRAPLDILKERFAKGEIDKDEFEERRRVLGE